jgi:hypothetical protein
MPQWAVIRFQPEKFEPNWEHANPEGVPIFIHDNMSTKKRLIRKIFEQWRLTYDSSWTIEIVQMSDEFTSGLLPKAK